MKPARLLGLAIVLAAGYAPAVCAQGTAADYERANGLRAKDEGLVANVPGNVTWIENTHRFWYRKVTRGGYEFVMVDADTQRKAPAFDHAVAAKYPWYDITGVGIYGTSARRTCGEHKRFDFLVRELLGVTPPAWTKKDHKASTADQEFE